MNLPKHNQCCLNLKKKWKTKYHLNSYEYYQHLLINFKMLLQFLDGSSIGQIALTSGNTSVMTVSF